MLAAVAKWPLPVGWRISDRAGRSLWVLWLALLVPAYNNAVHRVCVDVAFKAQRYDAAQQQRYELLQQLQRAGRHSVEVPALLSKEYQYPRTIFLHELEVFPRDIANEGMTACFGLDTVRVKALPTRTR